MTGVFALLLMLLIGGLGLFFAIKEDRKRIDRKRTEKPKELTPKYDPPPIKETKTLYTRPSAFYGLVYLIYFIGIIGFFGWIIAAIDLESWAIFGYGFGCMIGCLATGRVLALLEEINDELYRKRMSESP